MGKNQLPKTIYLPHYAKKQLTADDSFNGKWYDPIPYAALPKNGYEPYTFKLEVNKKVSKYDVLEKGFMYPDRNDELEDVIEMLEELTSDEIDSIQVKSGKLLDLEAISSLNISLVKKFPSGDLKPGTIFYNEKEKPGILLEIKNKKALGLGLTGNFDCEYKFTQLNDVVITRNWSGQILRYVGFIDGDILKKVQAVAGTGKHYGNYVK